MAENALVSQTVGAGAIGREFGLFLVGIYGGCTTPSFTLSRYSNIWIKLRLSAKSHE